MKKQLLTLMMPFVSITLFAQVITNENFDGLFVGNVGTDITGLTPSNEIYTQASNGTAPTTSTNAANDNFQIIENDATHLNVLQITGTNGDKGARQLWFGDFTTSWEFREVGNNIVEAEFDMFTGNEATSVNRMGLYIYDTTQTKILGGFSYATNTRVISGVAYYDATAQPGGVVGNYLFYLGTGATNITLNANEWVRMGVSFNMTTGQVIWRGPGFNGQVPGAAMATDPDRISLISISGSVPGPPAVPNTAAAVILFDNVTTTATATDTLLSIDEIAAIESKFSVFPNPATDVINISNADTKITAITLTDLNGRIVKQNSFDNLSNVQINISNLSSGMYLMDIASEVGTTTRKIIKN